MKIIKILFVVLSIGLLAGCAMDSDNTKKPLPQDCNQWCHNGWCSTHCDQVVSTTH